MRKERFTKQSEVHGSPEDVFAWHEQPGAVEKLTPPWERAEVVESPGSLKAGTIVKFKVFTGPIWKLWVAEHVEYDPPRLFVDIQRQGPFAYWHHRHRFEPTGSGTTLMTDEIEYELPLSWISHLIAGGFVRSKLQRMFDYRHQVVQEAFKTIQQRDQQKTIKQD